MIYKDALKIAEEVHGLLLPWCSRCEIAGSIRRKKPECGDVEIVCIVRSPLWFKEQIDKWPKVKGSAIGKYTQRIHIPSGIKLDIFMANKDNFGLIYAIRTGSADYSHKVLACGWVKAGFKSIDGKLTRISDDKIFPMREEKDLFDIIGIPFSKPEDRNP